MTEMVLLDSGPLGRVAHPQADPRVTRWVADLLQRGVRLVIPEIADYEVRRELLRAGRLESVARLDDLKVTLEYLPLTTEMMMRAAQVWANVRRQHQPTSPDKALDGDVILAAQATVVGSTVTSYVVATMNLKHLSRLTNAEEWDKIR